MKEIQNRIYLCNVRKETGKEEKNDKEKTHMDAVIDGNIDGIEPVCCFSISRRYGNAVPTGYDY